MAASYMCCPVLGWKREMLFPETGLYWMMPSPAIPNFETALLYPGTCLTEATTFRKGAEPRPRSN